MSEITVLTSYSKNIGDSLILYLFKDSSENPSNIHVEIDYDISSALYIYNSYVHSKNIYHIQTLDNILLDQFVKKITYKYIFADDKHITHNTDKINGHLIDRVRYIYGFKQQEITRPILSNPFETIKSKIVMTFDRGGDYQKHIHPRARLLYPENKKIIQKFINDNIYKYTFVEVGKNFSNLQNVINCCGLGYERTFNEIATCELFFGIHNGLMHFAAGLHKKSIIIINFPQAKEVILPRRANSPYHPDIHWLYPQNIHLHQDQDASVCRLLSYDSISEAFKKLLM